MTKAYIFGVICAAIATELCIGSHAVHAQGSRTENAVVTLDRGWEFRQQAATKPGGEENWLAAKVPGDVHLDLLENKKIPDLFFRDNERKLQWIENESWEYRLSFDVTPDLLTRANVDLVFDGLDGAAEVYVNEARVLNAANMFRTWRVPVKENLHAGKNMLRVVFPSPIKAAAQAAGRDPSRLNPEVEEKAYLRKAAYEYGWDWGPRFVTSGIWKPVRLEAWDQVRIADFSIQQRDVSADVAHINAEVEVESSRTESVRVDLDYGIDAKSAKLTETFSLHAGRNLIDFPIEVRQPKRWFPAGYGDQSLYQFSVQVNTDAGEMMAVRTAKSGLRSILLRRDLDKWGRSFELVVNGIPVFAKGADVIPFDSFPNRVTTANYRRILESARDANMNMIRHWGGGYYESDEFYAICDELGIMVWQDFMYANAWQPGEYSFKLEMEAEAEDQVRRLRNHPSIVLWCGNNEIESTKSGDASPNLRPDVRYKLWQDYLTQFSGILPKVVAKLSPETPYWPSSSSSDYEPLSDSFQSGDAHIWDVWHGRVPFATYETHHARFVTEFGFQSFPEMKTVETFTLPEDRTSIFTPVMLAHQKNNEGNSIIHDYLLKDYSEPKDFASFLYVSQVLQAEGIKTAAEHFRRSRPETMGSIFWQLNDCWPVASWSSIDYYGRWKALQYYARKFYAPVLVSPHVEDGALKVYVVSDKTEAASSTLRVRLIDFEGKVLLQESNDVRVEPLASKVYLSWTLKKLTEAGVTDPSKVFAVADISSGGVELSRNLTYLVPVKEIHLRPAKLKVEASGQRGSYTIAINSPVLARSVHLSFGDLDVELSDNYFDLLPGETVEVTARTSVSLDQLKGNMVAISLGDAFRLEAQRAVVKADK